MSILIGKKESLLSESEKHAQLLKIERPILLDSEIAKIKTLDKGNIKSGTISTLYNINDEINGFK